MVKGAPRVNNQILEKKNIIITDGTPKMTEDENYVLTMNNLINYNEKIEKNPYIEDT